MPPIESVVEAATLGSRDGLYSLLWLQIKRIEALWLGILQSESVVACDEGDEGGTVRMQ